MINSRRGFTLIETLFASALLILLMTATFQLLIPMLKAWQQSNVKGDTQREAMVAVMEMAHALRLSAIESVSIQTNTWTDKVSGKTFENDAVTMLSPIDHNTGLVDFASRDASSPDETSLVWHQFEVYYLNTGDNTLRVAELAITPDAQPSPSQLDFGKVTVSPKDRILAHNVFMMQLHATGAINTESPPALAGAVQILLELHNQGYVYQEQTAAMPLHHM